MTEARIKRIEQLLVTIEEVTDKIKLLIKEEQDLFDNMPEFLQDSEQGQSTQDAIYYLDYAENNLQDAYDNLAEIL